MSGFQLSSLVNQIFHINTDNSQSVNLGEGANQALFDLLNGLSSGDTILGKIVSSDEQSYTFITENNVTVNAKAQNGIVLEKGSQILFEVSKSNDSTISLRPLSTNLNASEMASSALKQAGLVVNARTIEMTIRNMEYGNPIDRHSLQESFRDVALNPEVPVKYIVDLQKLGIPRTEDNFSQYEAYLNMKNAVSESFMEIADAVSQGFAEKIVSSLSNGEANTGNLTFAERFVAVVRGEMPMEALFSAPEPANSDAVSLHELVLALDNLLKGDTSEKTVSQGEKGDPQSLEIIKNENGESVEKPGSQTETLNKSDALLPKNAVGSNISTEAAVVLKAEVKDFLDKIFKDVLLGRFTKSTEELSENPEVKELYKQLYSDTKRLTKAIEDVFPKESQAYAAVAKLNSNIDFMDSLNSFIPYVQIPFNSDGTAKAGELYVYKNKHSLSSKDSEITAFVHLDTKNLGPADVYIRLKDDRVSTHFTLDSEENLDFIMNNIDFLNKRLSDKGYSFSAEASAAKQDKSPIERMLESNTDRVIYAKTSFDARV